MPNLKKRGISLLQVMETLCDLYFAQKGNQLFGQSKENGFVRKRFLPFYARGYLLDGHGGWKLYRTNFKYFIFLSLNRKDRDEERSDGHRSSRHKRSKHSHRDSEKEDRSSSHGRDEMGKDLVIADSI